MVAGSQRLSPPGSTSRSGWPPRVVDQASVRAHNLSAVARLVRDRGRCSRGEIGELLQLNKGTVSGLVGELLALGVLEEGGAQAAGLGRPSRLLGLDSRIHVNVVVEVLVDQAVISCWSLSLDQVAVRTLTFRGSPGPAGQVLRRVGDALAGVVEELRADARVPVGVVVALPGLVDSRAGNLVLSDRLGWQNVAVQRSLQQFEALRDLPVLVERIGNLATIAESRALPDVGDLLCLHGGNTGIGAGVISGGRLLSGAHGRAGELLFTTWRDSGVRRGIGQPFPAMGRTMDADLRTSGSGRHASSAVERAARTRLALALGQRLATLIALLDPAVVVLAGRLAPLSAELAPLLADTLRHIWEPYMPPEVPIQAGCYGPDALRVGGATLLVDRLLHALAVPRAPAPTKDGRSLGLQMILGGG